jgi:exosortase sorting signal-containing protein
MRISSIPIISVLAFLCVISVHGSTTRAAVIFTTSRAQFFQDNPGLLLQTFDRGNVAPGGLASCVTPVDSSSNDDCFSPGDILPGIAFSTDPDFGDTDLAGPFWFGNLNPGKVLVPDGSKQKSVITFPDNSVKAVGLELGCLFDGGGTCVGQTMLVQVYGAGDALLGETIVQVDDTFESFLGINTDEQIERITFIDADLETQPSFNGVEKVYFPNAALHNIPALSQYGIAALALALGLAAAFAVRKRRAARA